jgi:hypothetical protein
MSSVITFVKDSTARGRHMVIMKDISWFWRTSYNLAISACTVWSGSEEEISELFEVVEQVRLLPRRAITDSHPNHAS